MCGQEGYYGTSAFQTLLDLQEFVALSRQYAQQMLEKEEAEMESDDTDEDTVENIQGDAATSIEKKKRRLEKENKARQAAAEIHKKRNMLSMYHPGEPCDFKNIQIPNRVNEVKQIHNMNLDDNYDIDL
jgi:hypothetical protein